MKKIFFGILLVALTGLSGCASTGGTGEKLVVSKHRLVTFTLNSQWRVVSDLDKDAIMQLGRKDEQAYILVYAFDKKDVGFKDLKSFTSKMSKNMQAKLTDPVVKDPTNVMMDGNPAIAYTISGTTSDMHFVFHNVAIEGRHAIYWISGWCLASQFQDIGQDMVNIMLSFKEI